MTVHAKGFDFQYLFDLFFDILDLFNTLIEVLRNLGDFLNGN